MSDWLGIYFVNSTKNPTDVSSGLAVHGLTSVDVEVMLERALEKGLFSWDPGENPWGWTDPEDYMAPIHYQAGRFCGLIWLGKNDVALMPPFTGGLGGAACACTRYYDSGLLLVVVRYNGIETSLLEREERRPDDLLNEKEREEASFLVQKLRGLEHPPEEVLVEGEPMTIHQLDHLRRTVALGS